MFWDAASRLWNCFFPEHPEMAEDKIDNRAAHDADEVGDVHIGNADAEAMQVRIGEMVIDMEHAVEKHQKPPVDKQRREARRQVELEEHVHERPLVSGLPVFPCPEVVPEEIVDDRAFNGHDACNAVVELCKGRERVKKAHVDHNAAAAHHAEFHKAKQGRDPYGDRCVQKSKSL
jgi:hypothetical protein